MTNEVSAVAFLVCCVLTLDRHEFIEKMSLLEVKPQHKCCEKCCLGIGETRWDCGGPPFSQLQPTVRGTEPHVTYHVSEQVLSESSPGLTPHPGNLHCVRETSICLYLHIWAWCFFQNSGMLFCQRDSAEELILPKSSLQPKTDKDQCRSTSGSLASLLGNSKVWNFFIRIPL